MVIAMHDDEIEFPQPVCTDDKPHAKHLIAGTWRTQCPGIEAPETAAGPNGCARTRADELQEWIEEQVAQPLESWENRLQQTCEGWLL